MSEQTRYNKAYALIKEADEAIRCNNVWYAYSLLEKLKNTIKEIENENS